MTATETKTKSITVIGRRWFNRGPGNTYHSAEIIVNGERVGGIDFAYGYGEMYLQNAADWLEANGYMPDREHHQNGSADPLWHYCREHGIQFVYSVTDVQRKKDL